MKTSLISIVILTCMMSKTFAQHYKTRQGSVQFEASVMGFEEVRAKTHSGSAILDCSNGTIASVVFINAFEFKIGLMQEHFNENYMESITYPKATFKGTLQDFQFEALEDHSKKELLLIGELTIRGLTKTIHVNCNVLKDTTDLVVSGRFILSPKDFNIQIPKLVQNKVAKEVQVSFHYILKP